MIYVKMKDGVVEDATFQTYGCVYSVACSDQMAELLIGKNPNEVDKLNADSIVNALGGIPPGKVHCAKMAAAAGKLAVADATGKKAEVEEDTTPARVALSISEELKLKHRVAEMFDEWMTPELAAKGFVVTLDDIDTSSLVITLKSSSRDPEITEFIQSFLERYFKERFEIQYKGE